MEMKSKMGLIVFEPVSADIEKKLGETGLERVSGNFYITTEEIDTDHHGVISDKIESVIGEANVGYDIFLTETLYFKDIITNGNDDTDIGCCIDNDVDERKFMFIQKIH